MAFPPPLRREHPPIYAAALGGLILLVILGVVLGNRLLTPWIEGDSFHQMLEQETSKGMHFDAHYAPIHRVGFLGIRADSGEGENGSKTIVSLQGQNVTGWFNPFGVLLRRWQIDDLHFDSGTVMLQQTDAPPNQAPPPGLPWYLFFWPDRVYLEDIKVDRANILFHLRGQESGIYQTFLEITPNGRDFEYDARGGEFKTPASPPLLVLHTHLLIRKPRLTCDEFLLGDDPAHPEENVRVTGDAGLQQDRSIHLKVDLNSLNLPPWLPLKLRDHVRGHATGHFDYASANTGLETGHGSGQVEIAGAVLHQLKAIRAYLTDTGSPDPGDLKLSPCKMDLKWDQGALSAENIEVECAGVFRLTGHATIAKDQTLSGEFQFGLTDPYLKWLPSLTTTIFTRTEGPYHFTTVHLSGTAQKPQQDLAARVGKVVGDHPLVALKLFFNSAANWFDFD